MYSLPNAACEKMPAAAAARTCWICYNPIRDGELAVKPCACKGTMGYVHSECLVAWITKSKKDACMQCGTKYNQTHYYANVGWCLLDQLTVLGVPCTTVVSAAAIAMVFLLFHCLMSSFLAGPARYAMLTAMSPHHHHALAGTTSWCARLLLELKLFTILVLVVYFGAVTYRQSMPTFIKDHIPHTSLHEALEDFQVDLQNGGVMDAAQVVGAHAMAALTTTCSNMLQTIVDRHRHVQVFSPDAEHVG
jgi:hypothetical protein